MIAPVHLHAARGPGAAPSQGASAARSGDFASVLDSALGEARAVRFSAHAMQRIRERNIQLTPADHARIAKSTDAASAKGSREALVLMDRLALIVGLGAPDDRWTAPNFLSHVVTSENGWGTVSHRGTLMPPALESRRRSRVGGRAYTA